MKSTIKRLLKTIIPAKHRAWLRHFRRKVKYFGWMYKCPICRSHLRILLPFGQKFPVLIQNRIIGGSFRPNARCPVCRSLDRERLVYLYLLNKTKIFQEHLKLLHLAPEKNLSTILKNHSNIDYLTADLNSNKVMVKMDITQIDYPDNSFDAVICNHVLEHVIDDKKAIRELFRVLRPGGWGILQVPISLNLNKTYEDVSVTSPSEREKIFGQSDHVRMYAIDYLDRLRESGFEVSPFKWWIQGKEFGNPDNKYALLQHEIIIFVNKPNSD